MRRIVLQNHAREDTVPAPPVQTVRFVSAGDPSGVRLDKSATTASWQRPNLSDDRLATRLEADSYKPAAFGLFYEELLL
jgi:hypothetical protein